MGSRWMMWFSVALVAACSGCGQTAGGDSGAVDSGAGGTAISLGDASSGPMGCNCIVQGSSGGSSEAGGSAAAGGTQSSAGGAGTVEDGGDTDATGGPCTTDQECPSGLRCGYLMADGCSAKGVCVQYNCAGNACIHPGGPPCGCDGQQIDYVNAVIGVGYIFEQYTSAPYIGPSPGLSPCSWYLDAGGTN
jgi:hypothetical protein